MNAKLMAEQDCMIPQMHEFRVKDNGRYEQ